MDENFINLIFNPLFLFTAAKLAYPRLLNQKETAGHDDLEINLDLDAIRRPSTLRYARLPLLRRERIGVRDTVRCTD